MTLGNGGLVMHAGVSMNRNYIRIYKEGDFYIGEENKKYRKYKKKKTG